MRLVSWNCKGAFHRKHEFAAELRPDILIVPECKKLSEIPQSLFHPAPKSFLWFGDNPSKGLAVFCYGDYSLNLHPSYDARFRWIVPLVISGATDFTLFAVWTLPVEESKSYVRPLIDAYSHYKPLMQNSRFVWAGDFNANFIWDKPSRKFKFCDFVALLSEHDSHSVYHHQTDCRHGEEVDNSFYQYHHADKGYHIDYVFATDSMRPHGSKITFGSYQDWSKRSDHMPVICDFFERPDSKAT